MINIRKITFGEDIEEIDDMVFSNKVLEEVIFGKNRAWRFFNE
jgi:hypothetical protein